MTDTWVKFLGGLVVGYIITSFIDGPKAYQTTVTPYGGGTTAVAGGLPATPWAAQISGFTPGVGATTVSVTGVPLPTISMNYDEAHTVPCALGSC